MNIIIYTITKAKTLISFSTKKIFNVMICKLFIWRFLSKYFIIKNITKKKCYF